MAARRSAPRARRPLTSPPIAARSHLWKVFQKSVPGTFAHVQVGSYFDRFSLVIAAASSGMGAAILPTYLIETELASGALLNLASVNDNSEHNYYLATPPGRISPAAAEFLTWIRGQVSRRVKPV